MDDPTPPEISEQQQAAIVEAPPLPAPVAAPAPIPAKPEKEEGVRMSFFEHLVELRKRIIASAIGVGIGMVIGLSVSERVFGYLARPMLKALHDAHLEEKLIYSS